jgi:hypothetical protein
MDSLPKITESKDEYLLDRHRKKIFSRKLKTLVDLSEGTPTENQLTNKRGSAIFLDCLTIEEEEAEDVQIEPLDLLSNDNESSKISSPMSKSLSKKFFKVDEMSAEGEDKKRKRFESDVGASHNTRSSKLSKRRRQRKMRCQSRENSWKKLIKIEQKLETV